MKKFFVLLCYVVSMSASSDTTKSDRFPEVITYKNNFSTFSVSFADYPKGQEKFYELYFRHHANLPDTIRFSNHPYLGLKISGNNHSDDLFMYAYKKISGLKPNTYYHVHFSVELASNADATAVGTGGAPGASVYVKAGVIVRQPARKLDQNNYYRINLDKGNQSVDGKEMVLIGDIGVNTRNGLYTLKTLPDSPTKDMQDKIEHYTFRTGRTGHAWLVVGTDSAFESTTTLFYTNMVATFREVQ